MSSAVLPVFLACYGARCAVEWGLELLNLRHLVRHGHEVPPALASRVPAGAALRGRDYAMLMLAQTIDADLTFSAVAIQNAPVLVFSDQARKNVEGSLLFPPQVAGVAAVDGGAGSTLAAAKVKSKRYSGSPGLKTTFAANRTGTGICGIPAACAFARLSGVRLDSGSMSRAGN